MENYKEFNGQYSCNGSANGCKGERFGGCRYCDEKAKARGLEYLARVVSIHSASKFVDERPRVTLRLEACDSPLNEIRFPIPEADCLTDYHLDQEFTVVISPKLTACQAELQVAQEPTNVP